MRILKVKMNKNSEISFPHPRDRLCTSRVHTCCSKPRTELMIAVS